MKHGMGMTNQDKDSNANEEPEHNIFFEGGESDLENDDNLE
jgi:hypothetical protein